MLPLLFLEITLDSDLQFNQILLLKKLSRLKTNE